MDASMNLPDEQQNPQSLIAVPEQMVNVAGVITFWSLQGVVDRQDLVDSWVGDGMSEDDLPDDPSPESVLWRAAQASIPPGRRMLVRPLKTRGCLELVSEKVVQSDGVVKERIVHTSELRGRVQKEDGKSPQAVFDPADHPLVDPIRASFRVFSGTLTPPDVSGWLVWAASHLCSAVVLRDRGGFYFIPKDRLETWRKVERAVQAAGNHRVYEIPAMRTKEAVEAIVDSLRKEAEAEMETIEAWLKDQKPGEASTKGVNAYVRNAEECAAKVAGYAKLLDVRLQDLTDRLTLLRGAVQAAKLVELPRPA